MNPNRQQPSMPDSKPVICQRFIASRWLLWGIVLMLILSMPTSASAAQSAQSPQSAQSSADIAATQELATTADPSLMAEVKDILETYHVSDVSDEDLEDAAINGMIESLGDPYTVYMTSDEWNSYQNSVEQNYVGIGIRLGVDEDGGIYAAEVFPDSPAYEAGIVKGDYIAAVNGVSAAGKTTQDLVNMIAGDEHTTVEMTIISNGQSQTFTVTRRSIHIPVVTSERLNEGYGYIKIDTFSSDADERFEEALADLMKHELYGLVIDLRNNPGGYVDTVGHIANEFIEEGILMHTRDKMGKDDPVTIRNGKTVDVPVVILVNEQSASGSEVFAGAMQDYGTAVVVGVQSFGKGSVQSIIPLSNGGVLKTTVQEYLTPKGRRVNGVGITPDIIVNGPAAQLITAFREAGLSSFAVKANKTGLMINDINFNESLPYVEQDGAVYVHSRVLGALSGLDVEWNSAEAQVVMNGQDTRAAFSVHDSSVIQTNGMTYIDAAYFAERVSGFAWSWENGELLMTVQ